MPARLVRVLCVLRTLRQCLLRCARNVGVDERITNADISKVGKRGIRNRSKRYRNVQEVDVAEAGDLERSSVLAAFKDADHQLAPARDRHRRLPGRGCRATVGSPCRQRR